MATDSSFQPEKPHPETQGGGGLARTHLVVAGAAACMVVMILAIAAPRFLGEGGLRWVLTLGAGVLTFLVVVGIGFARGSG